MELQGGASGNIGVGGGVVGGEDLDVERVVLEVRKGRLVEVTLTGRNRRGRRGNEGGKGSFTLRPITPRQAIEGIRVAILREGGRSCSGLLVCVVAVSQAIML